ncbi:MAG: hypothetical protein WD042_12910 [Phycisphaeraceae bacterium]
MSQQGGMFSQGMGSGAEGKFMVPRSATVQPEGLPNADDTQAYAAPHAGSKLLSQGTLLILMVAGIAGGSIYLMRMTQGDVRASSQTKEVEARIEQALVKLANPAAMASDDPLNKDNMKVLFDDTDSVVAMFNDDTATRQVPLEYLQKNPFDVPTRKTAAGVTVPAPTGNAAELARQRQIKQLATEFAGLKLDAVMLGRVPVAIVNSKVVKAGDKVGSFTVAEITGMQVTLSALDQTYTLAMAVKNKEDESRKPNF